MPQGFEDKIHKEVEYFMVTTVKSKLKPKWDNLILRILNFHTSIKVIRSGGATKVVSFVSL